MKNNKHLLSLAFGLVVLFGTVVTSLAMEVDKAA